MIAACAGDSTAPLPGTRIELSLDRLASLDPAIDGTYGAWVVNGNGVLLSAGRFEVRGHDDIALTSPVDLPTHLMITIEPPGDDDETPSIVKLLGGRFDAAGSAQLELTGYLTPVGMSLEDSPGVHVLATHSGTAMSADAGLWLVDARVDSSSAAFFQTFTPLTPGWTYEGWVVRDIGTPTAVWLSYGQFVPNNLRKARFRDDSGLGPFSGFTDYERALLTEVHYPGDDWVANPRDLPFPDGVSLPIDLNGDATRSASSRWTHVITIEPRPEPDGVRTEPPWTARPFFLRPYVNAIGDAPAHEPRIIGFVSESLPRGSARIVATSETR